MRLGTSRMPLGRYALAAVMVLTAILTLPSGLIQARVASAQGIKTERDVEYGQAGGVRLLLDVFLPDPKDSNHTAIVMIHGGGFSKGDKAQMEDNATFYAQNGFAVFNINYRLMPQFLYPAQVLDAQTAVAWVRANAKRFDVNPNRIGALGASSGGNMAALLGTLGSGPRNQGSRVAVVITWSGLLDTTDALFIADLTRIYSQRQPGTTRAQVLAIARKYSPIDDVDPSDAPTYMSNSSNEVIPVTEPQEMASALRRNGVPYVLKVVPGSRHAQFLAQRPSTGILPETISFLQKYLVRYKAPKATTKSSPTPTHSPEASSSPGRSKSFPTLFGAAVAAAAILLVALVTALVRRRSAYRRYR